MSETQRFFFVHLQKTAGTALFRRLRHQFGADAVYPMPEHQFRVDGTIDVDYLCEVFAAQHDQILVVTGHFPYCTTELLGVPFSTFTVLREPVDRTLSLLRHRKQLDPSLHEATLEEIYNQPMVLHSLVHNHMVKMLALTPDTMTHGAMTMVAFDESWLERAKENLLRIDVVGLQERFDEFCADLEWRFGWDLGPAEIGNATEPVAVSDLFTERIRRDNRLDCKLYEFARQLVNDRSSTA